MKKFLEKVVPGDVIAIFVIIGGFILKYKGADGIVGSILMTTVSFYFGKRLLSDLSIGTGGGPRDDTTSNKKVE